MQYVKTIKFQIKIQFLGTQKLNHSLRISFTRRIGIKL